MPNRGTRRLIPTASAVLSAIALAAPAGAQAAGPAAATITSCKADRMTVAGKVALAGKAARKVRGANLQLRFQAMPLFGLPRGLEWRDLGKKAKGSGEQEFTGLGADNWAGVLSWRFKKGRKTVLSGAERSQPVKVGRAKGRANCTLSEGLKPPDTTPPTLFILPLDEIWHRVPTAVQLLAQDDFSGVQGVRYSLDGGPITELRNGGTFAITTEGAHTVQWAATDVAGNTGARSATVKVDAAPPTKPVLVRPLSVTSSTRPLFQWSAATDSGSGLRGYFLAIRRAADGSLVALQPLDAAATSAASPATLADGEAYTATVTAVDNTDKEPWASESDAFTFRVDTKAEVAGVAPAAGTVLAGAAKDGNFTINLDRPADPSTVTQANVVLDRNAESGTDPAYTAGCAGTPCTSITVDPSGSLPEGRYVLSVNNLGSEEGTVFAGFSAAYAVPFPTDSTMSASTPPTTPPTCAIAVTDTSTPVTLDSTAAGETATLDFDWTASGGTWTMQAYYGDMAVGNEIARSIDGSGHDRLTFPVSGHPAGALTFRLIAKCSGVSVSASNLVGSRVP